MNAVKEHTSAVIMHFAIMSMHGSYHCICKPYSVVYLNHGQEDGNDCIKTGEAYDYIFIFDNYIYQVFLYT